MFNKFFFFSLTRSNSKEVIIAWVNSASWLSYKLAYILPPPHPISHLSLSLSLKSLSLASPVSLNLTLDGDGHRCDGNQGWRRRQPQDFSCRHFIVNEAGGGEAPMLLSLYLCAVDRTSFSHRVDIEETPGSAHSVEHAGTCFSLSFVVR